MFRTSIAHGESIFHTAACCGNFMISVAMHRNCFAQTSKNRPFSRTLEKICKNIQKMD
jgi:hypothetical protein